jgi:protein involved in ribonucleotide reduction
MPRQTQIVYFSKTGNIKRFVGKLSKAFTVCSIDSYNKGEYILITPTYGRGQIPQQVNDFLLQHSDKMIAVVGSGNLNWGVNYAKASKIIASSYKVPLLMTFELSGVEKDINNFEKAVEQFYETH